MKLVPGTYGKERIPPWIKSSIKAPGTLPMILSSSQEHQGSLSYSNSIRGRTQGHPGRVIVRHKVPQVKFTCKVDGQSAVEIVHGSDTQKDHVSYDVSISFLQSPASQNMGVGAPPYTHQREEVFLQATLHSHNPNLRLVVDTCVASPDPNDFTTVKYELIQEG